MADDVSRGTDPTEPPPAGGGGDEIIGATLEGLRKAAREVEHVADRYPGLAVAERDHVVPVAPDLGVGAAGEVAGGEVEPGELAVNQGSLYPALQRLEHRGFITSAWGTTENGRRARFYRLTAAGRRALGEEMASWRRFTAAVEVVLGAT